MKRTEGSHVRYDRPAARSSHYSTGPKCGAEDPTEGPVCTREAEHPGQHEHMDSIHHMIYCAWS